jgi:hypothetical protein
MDFCAFGQNNVGEVYDERTSDQLNKFGKKLKKSLKRLPIKSKTPTIKKPNAKSNQRQRGFLMR